MAKENELDTYSILEQNNKEKVEENSDSALEDHTVASNEQQLHI